MTVTTQKQPKTYNLSDLIRYYEIYNRAEGKSSKTFTWYSANLWRFKHYVTSRHLPDSIDCLDTRLLREYILHLMKSHRYENHPYNLPTDKPLSVFTIHGHVRTLRAFFNWLAKEGFTETNIAREIKPPKLVQKVVSPLSDQEIVSILHAFNASNSIHFRDQVIFMVLLDTGLRIGELLNLRMNDVQPDQGLLKVLGKGKKERLVPMGNKSQKVLQRYLFRHRPEPFTSGVENVFLTARGTPITGNCARLMFARLASRSGVHRLHAHLCRHTFATRFLINGGDIFTLQLILGHSTLEMVRHYVNLASTQIALKHHEYSPLDRLGVRGS